MTLDQGFGILAGISLLVAGLLILKQTKDGVSTPNFLTWLISLLLSSINLPTFYKVVNGNKCQAFVMLVSFLTIVVVFFYTLIKGKFAKIRPFDKMLFVLSIVVGILWKFTDDRMAQFLVQVLFFLGSIATIVGLLRNTLKEYYRSWCFATSAYIISIAGFIFAGNRDWLVYFGPVLNGIVANGLILLLSSKKTNGSWLNIFYARRALSDGFHLRAFFEN